jgi:hypothetical protein
MVDRCKTFLLPIWGCPDLWAVFASAVQCMVSNNKNRPNFRSIVKAAIPLSSTERVGVNSRTRRRSVVCRLLFVDGRDLWKGQGVGLQTRFRHLLFKASCGEGNLSNDPSHYISWEPARAAQIFLREWKAS